MHKSFPTKAKTQHFYHIIFFFDLLLVEWAAEVDLSYLNLPNIAPAYVRALLEHHLEQYTVYHSKNMHTYNL